MTCRNCGSENLVDFVNLGHQPPSNAYLKLDALGKPEITFPLSVYFCEDCLIVQAHQVNHPSELFTAEYAYLSSSSISWLKHAEDFCSNMIDRFDLDENRLVAEIGSNDGYLLQYFLASGVQCFGIEPTAAAASLSRQKGIITEEIFFNQETSILLTKKHGTVDLLIGNNVYAHVPDINSFTHGLKSMLAPEGVISLEFPHLLSLMTNLQFDTIYHEHFSYLSLLAVKQIFKQNGLKIFDCEELETHGGSLRIFGCHEDCDIQMSPKVKQILDAEFTAQLNRKHAYIEFQKRINILKLESLIFLLEQRRKGRLIGAYGAAAKGNTFLNYLGISTDLIEFVADASPLKQGKFLPGSHIPVVDLDFLISSKPDIIVILPWNLRSEVIDLLKSKISWPVQFVTFVPELNCEKFGY